MSVKEFLLSERNIALLSWAILGAYIAPLFILGEDSPILIHDNLDGSIVTYTILIESGVDWFTLGGVSDGVMVEYPRDALPSELSLITFLYLLLSPFYAHAINISLTHLFAFIGMRRLLANSSYSDDKPIISYGAALAFALLPFSPNGGLTVAGIPLAVSSFISFREGRHSAIDWLILVFLTFYSSFIVGFLFLYIAVFGFIVADKIRKKPVFWQFTALGIISVLHLFTMIRLFNLVYGSDDFVGNRSERQFFVDESLISSFISTFDFAGRHFFLGYYHAPSEHTAFIGLAIFFALQTIILDRQDWEIKRIWTLSIINSLIVILTSVWFIFSWGPGIYPLWISILSLCCYIVYSEISQNPRYRLDFNDMHTSSRLLLSLIFCSFLISTWYGFWGKFSLFQIAKNSISLLGGIDFGRFFFLQPMIWSVAFFISLRIIHDCGENSEGHRITRLSSIIVGLLLTTQISHLMTLDDDNDLLQVGGVALFTSDDMTYAEFFSEDLFGEIKQEISMEENDPKVVSIGIHPSIASYDGIWSLDSYALIYSLDYKNQFRQIISDELDKNEEMEYYFDNWGNRCYIFSSDLWTRNLETSKMMNTKDSESNYPIEISFNTTAFARLGGTHILSSVELGNYEELGLNQARVFESNDSPWRIHVYHVE